MMTNQLTVKEIAAEVEVEMRAYRERVAARPSHIAVGDNDFDAMLAVSLETLQQDHPEQACRMLMALLALRPDDARVFVSFGACWEKLGAGGTALACFAFATKLDPHSPLPILRLGECLIAVGERELGRQSLWLAARLAGDSVVDQPLKAHAEGLLALMEATASS